MTKNQIKIAQIVANAADRDGTIQAEDAVVLFPGVPELHSVMTVADAWRERPELDGLSSREISEQLWG